MTKVAINNCWGGFSLSDAAVALWKEKTGEEIYSHPLCSRDDPTLIKVIEELGVEKASGGLARISIVEVPDDVAWHIHEYDGMEHVAEEHNTWS